MNNYKRKDTITVCLRIERRQRDFIRKSRFSMSKILQNEIQELMETNGKNADVFEEVKLK